MAAKTKFDAEQKKAIEHIDGPFLCIAGPGSGKTTVIVNRVLYMATHGVDPSTILVVTFSRKAAQEMEERYKKLKGSVEGPVFSTIHALALRVVRNSENFRDWGTISEEQKKKFFGDMQKEGRLPEAKNQDYRKVIENVLNDFARFRMRKKKDVFRPECFSSMQELLDVYNRYVAFKKKNKVMDFDDMLVFCYQQLTVNKALAEQCHESYRYIMVDEYQDTSELQNSIIKILARPRNNLFVCGDDDQSIYGFRSAAPEVMIGFRDDYPDCGIARLSTNYRSTRKIVAASKNLINHNVVRFDKDIAGKKPDTGLLEVKQTCDLMKTTSLMEDILKENEAGRAFKDMAILTRTNKEAAEIAFKFAANNIPFYCRIDMADYHTGGFYNTCISYLRLAFGATDWKTIREVYNKPFRCVKNEILDRCKDFPDLLYELKCDRDNRAMELCVKFNQGVEKAKKYVKEGGHTLREIMEYCYKVFHIERYLDAFCKMSLKDKEEMEGIYKSLLREMEEYSDVEEYVSMVQMRSSFYRSSMSENATNKGIGVNIMTMHSAKGLEWDYVCLVSANYGNTPYITKSDLLLPDDQITSHIEEERRLFYVGMTRAKEKLVIWYNTDDKKSMFLDESKASDVMYMSDIPSEKEEKSEAPAVKRRPRASRKTVKPVRASRKAAFHDPAAV